MKSFHKFVLVIVSISFFQTGCNTGMDEDIPSISDYSGTASISQGFATATINNLFECSNGRDAPLGISTAMDGSTWTVPAQVNLMIVIFHSPQTCTTHVQV